MFCCPTRSFSLSLAFSLAVCFAATLLPAQEPSSRSTPVVPAMVNFPGTLTDVSGKPMTGVVGVTFLLYREQQGGAPLWMETQNVSPDKAGHYSAMLGSTTSQGLPANLFVSGEARWLGVQISGQPEQPRVLLLSVPYAMKAGDAETLGGLPLSAFMLATASTNSQLAPRPSGVSPTSPSALPPASSTVTTTGGTVNAIPLFTTATNVQNSILTQTGATAVNVAGKLNLPAQGVATATAGKFSRPESFVASAFNNTSSMAVPQTFQFQVEPAANNTAAPYGTLNLLYGSGTAAPAETGLKINNKGVIAFATGQTFPGTGKGTITSVIAGTGLTGGGTTGAVTLNLNTANIPLLGASNDFTAPQEFKSGAGIGVPANTDGYTPLSVGGTASFGTWLSLANTSTGGHTWNIISAGSGNAEGAGNLGITDLTGKSTIWLEGNTNTSSLSATGAISGASITSAGSTGGAIIDADVYGKNNGANIPGLRFGGAASGEGIASNRVSGENGFGLQLYTEFTPRISILQTGQVGVGITNPESQLTVLSTSNLDFAIGGYGGNAANGSGGNGSDGLYSAGGNGDLNADFTYGASGVYGIGGTGGKQDGAGGVFFGGNHSTYGDGIVATAGSANSWAGFFQGNVGINGVLSGGGASFRIDHPLDPANRYLSHSAVESPDMMNIYNGNVVTDANGDAVVPLPEWFETLNRDFRYQLTVIGQFAQAIVTAEVANHQFSIKTDKPAVKVSWQVTGIRQDAWANAHRIPVEEQKNARERGHYLSPELYGAPEEAGIQWARHPEMMKRIKDAELKKIAVRPAVSVAR